MKLPYLSSIAISCLLLGPAVFAEPQPTNQRPEPMVPKHNKHENVSSNKQNVNTNQPVPQQMNQPVPQQMMQGQQNQNFKTNPMGTATNEKSSIKDIKEDKYEKLLKLLESKDSSKASSQTEEDKTEKIKIQKKQDQFKNEEFGKALLPTPIKSLIIGDKITVFAEYREKSLSDDASPSKNSVEDYTKDPLISPLVEDLKNENFEYRGMSESDIKFNKKTIKLRTGDIFGKWQIVSMSASVVIFQNITTKQYIKKFY